MKLVGRLLAVMSAVCGLACALEESAPTMPSPLLRADEEYGIRVAGSGRFPAAVSDFNAFIMQAARSFGNASYLWSGDGVTREIRYQGVLIAEPYGVGKCHCVGATFQVYMTAYQAWDKQYKADSLRGLTPEQVKQLKQVWYVATSAEQGSQAALTRFDLGAAVTDWSKAQPGDPVQLWRQNGSGHSVIFDSWVKQGGQITGITYFSCQNSGAGFVSETIGSGTKEVDPKRVYIVHPRAPSDPPDASILVDSRPPVSETGVAEATRLLDGSAGPPPGEPSGPRPAEGCQALPVELPAAAWPPLLVLLPLLLARRRMSLPRRRA